MQSFISIDTTGARLYEFTNEARQFVNGQKTGLLTVFVRHTCCSLLIQENADPEVKRDLDAFFSRLVPRACDPSMHYLTHRLEGPDDMPAHIN